VVLALGASVGLALAAAGATLVAIALLADSPY
jgi:hypothetical protein